MRARPVSLTGAIAVTVLGLLTGCGAPAEVVPPLDGLPDGVSVEVVQNRSDVVPRRLQIKVVNDLDVPLEVNSVTFDSAAFVEPAVWERGTTVPAGTARDLPVELPEASCATEEARASVAISFEVEGRRAVATVEPADPLDQLPELTLADCVRADVERATEVELGPLVGGGPGVPALLEVSARPTGDTEATLERIRSTVLFTVLDASGARATDVALADLPQPTPAEGSTEDDATRRWAVPIAPSRCDAHALAEDKQGTLFGFDVTTTRGSAVYERAASEELRHDLYAFYAQYCGLTGP
ncbi:hypothetical protein CLV46_2349 [Diaminobutyricimonas aerilata]|uniref:Lipoprotein n=1 Tax=Diaminobutyricimonas aerilata TaxID=1162967 RepID=A0A2M9CLK1_9MICO|nr:hypothetical protein [Diaminobutyricimonas aerilata]PJJ72773.1 hypothetical protein CLV46_2349 [Diaminobutyricimonas aerilata]